MATITIRNLSDEVKQKLRLRAARHNRSMEAEAREILRRGLQDEWGSGDGGLSARERKMKKIEAAIGIWKDRMGGPSTDEIMHELRGDD